MSNKIITYLKSSQGLLLLIILVGAILRFWNYFNMPYTYDEMSALLRTNFTNFDDLIEKGVKIDTHPPGVQVFMYYWTQLFGQKEWVVKMPFILMGLSSIYLTFLIAKNWFNDTVALISCSLLSVMQFTVMYSQIARPYISGMFLLLCMTYYWSQLIQNPEKQFWKNWSLTVLFGALCAYNHHFSLLTAGLIGITGLFIIDKKYFLKYISLALVIFLLYLPNIGIFLHQLNRGGVGEWLGAPQPDFIVEFIRYCFHFSYFFGALIIGLMMYGFYTFKKGDFQFNKWRISGILFIAVFLIGYFYSVKINPVLQFSMLLFVFPFLLFFLFGWISKLNNKQNTIIVLAILLVGTSSLTLERDHFRVFYQNRYFQMKADAMELANEDTEIIFINYEEIIAHPFPNDFNITYWNWDKKYTSIQDFQSKIASIDKPKVMIGYLEQMPKELIGIALEYFPYVIEQRCYHGATTYLLSKAESNKKKSFVYFQNSFKEKNIEKFMNHNPSNISQNQAYLDSNEWSLGMEINLSDKIQHKYDMIHIKAKIKLKRKDQVVSLVATVKKGEEDLLWLSSGTEKFTPNEEGYVTLILTFDYNNITFDMDKNLVLSTFIWNQDKEPIAIEDISLELLKGNRNKYAIFEKIH
jgi:hypothetical protein